MEKENSPLMETSLKCQNVTHFGLNWVARQDEDVE